MLTLIPKNNLRDELLELDAKKDDKIISEQEEKRRLQILAQCNIHNVSELPNFINDNILIRHTGKDQTLTPASRKVRVRGKIFKDKNDNERWMRGDCVRGQLHLQSWYGAIAPVLLDENNKMRRDEDGRFLTDKDHPKYVKRFDLKYKANSMDSGFTSWEDLKEVIVDQTLFEKMYNQYPGLSFKEACTQGLYMIDNQGNRVNRIRHVRCYVPTVKNPVHVKKQTYLSDKEYKQDYLAASGDLYAMVKYQSPDEKQIAYRPYTLFEIAQNRTFGLEDIPSRIEGKKGVTLHKVHLLHKSLNVLIYKDSADELRGASQETISQRLFTIRGFEAPGRIKLVHHLSAKTDTELGKGGSIKDWNALPPKIRCGISTLHYLLENDDFVFAPNEPNGIKFL